ncbi:monosaccharide ABC transporter substrate-binding protein (CUT2 family) [Shimia isoporae]|uniref:Monosaccharide ABC transporter substrate-binding protein (CUT2 family) n=1 Tax=Shimia isoporae TaxID=647720 RepID=A0A4R1NYJ8_9RHOB|nr:sugar ABC transporter substrate-binding protein [Shimia isoporae]TCL10302.1 monosaccharide ABC transporter substrate-binding protein (CUT2 family) [Shimia isoporae]
MTSLVKKTTGLLAGLLIAGAASAGEMKMAWYASTVHPYFDEVQKGVDQFAADYGVEVTKRLGQDWTQDNQNENVTAMAAQGFNAFSIFPSDVAGAHSLYEELDANGITIVDFGQPTQQPTPAKFFVGTQLKEAAMIATEQLIQAMGGKGNIINVLEVPGEATRLRQEGVEEVVAKYPDVQIIQTVGDLSSIEDSVEKVQNAIAANIGKIDGMIATGYTPTVAIAQLLTEYHEGGGDKIHFFGIDTDAVVMDAIRAGHIDGTMAQNPYGHGYIPMVLLKLMGEGYTKRDGVHAIDAGVVPVTAANIDTYQDDISALTKSIIASLETEYLQK